MSTGIKIYSEKDIKRICKEEILKKCLKEDYRKIDESGRKMLYKIMNLVEQSKLKEVLKIIDKKINRLKSGNHKKDIFKYWKVTTKELEKLKSQLSGVRK